MPIKYGLNSARSGIDLFKSYKYVLGKSLYLFRGKVVDYRLSIAVPFFNTPCCVCVLCGHPIYSERQACGRTSQGTQEEGHTGFSHFPSAVLAVMFLARRVQPFLFLVDREVEFCVPTM